MLKSCCTNWGSKGGGSHEQREKCNKRISKVSNGLGYPLHGYRHFDWGVSSGYSRFSQSILICKGICSYGNPHLAYDLPYDDESGFSKYQKRGEKSKRAVCNMDNKLAH